MKKKKWIFIVIGILLIISIFFILGHIKKQKERNEVLSKSRNEMIKKLKNFSYNGIVSIDLVGYKFDTNLDCKEDLNNRLGYCNITNKLVDIEEYLDYKNNVTYTKTDIISNDSTDKWRKSKEKDIGEVTPMFKMFDGIKISKEEKTDNGTIYIGEINGRSLRGILNSANKGTSRKFNLTKLFKRKVPVRIFVNNDNYVESIESNFKFLGIGFNIDIKYTDFNNTPSISLPGEVNEL